MSSRMRTALAGAGAVAVLATVAPAATATATTPTAPTSRTADASVRAGCTSGYFCAYDDQGVRRLKKLGNWKGTKENIKSYYNNGDPDAGGAIVHLLWKGAKKGVCINPGQTGTFKKAHTITEVWWYKKCPL